MTKYLVFGHKNPDTDAIGSAIAFAAYLNLQGKEAEAVALGSPNDETAYALEYFGFEAPRVVESVADQTDRVALVDHNEPQQSVADIQEVTVDYVVDHHRIAGFETAQPLYYRCEPIGSTASVLFKLYREAGLAIDPKVAGIMLSAIISDTLLFKSPTATAEDREIADQLAETAGVDLESYGLEMLKAGTNIADKSDRDLMESDSKDFDMNGAKIRIGQVNTVDFSDIILRESILLQEMDKDIATDELDLFVLVITNILDNDSFAFVSGKQTELAAEAFGQSLVNHRLELPGIVSRKKQIVPPLQERFDQA
ncbi:manganese-dependent inorganic pyrophosphatase [Hutsoniella sourekii]|uniref:manganese-dependent inorganic pyrophosphatase n=1 Tax=Hutsoniella sourekii TaxID=87650 RepID=UPI00047F6BD6|nr:manganese-dependent inorganic pyrophosphatase [Hutsoniella sourekii]